MRARGRHPRRPGNRLPYTFRGYSTNFSAPDPHDNGVQLLTPIDAVRSTTGSSISTMRGYVLDYLGYDLREPLLVADWLTFPMQKLRTLTAGAVYHDGAGLSAVRERLAFYPRDVWLYLLAAGWARIGQEEHLMGRAGSVGDEVGAALIAARLVRDVMRLGFLMERQYPPYPKWFGTAFRQLACAEDCSQRWSERCTRRRGRLREQGLVPAWEELARMHNAVGADAATARNSDGVPRPSLPRHGDARVRRCPHCGDHGPRRAAHCRATAHRQRRSVQRQHRSLGEPGVPARAAPALRIAQGRGWLTDSTDYTDSCLPLCVFILSIRERFDARPALRRRRLCGRFLGVRKRCAPALRGLALRAGAQEQRTRRLRVEALRPHCVLVIERAGQPRRAQVHAAQVRPAQVRADQ